jgi:hypothetical protein
MKLAHFMNYFFVVAFTYYVFNLLLPPVKHCFIVNIEIEVGQED